MIWTLFQFLIVISILGLATSHTLGGTIHILPVLAVVSVTRLMHFSSVCPPEKQALNLFSNSPSPLSISLQSTRSLGHSLTPIFRAAQACCGTPGTLSVVPVLADV